MLNNGQALSLIHISIDIVVDTASSTLETGFSTSAIFNVTDSCTSIILVHCLLSSPHNRPSSAAVYSYICCCSCVNALMSPVSRLRSSFCCPFIFRISTFCCSSASSLYCLHLSSTFTTSCCRSACCSCVCHSSGWKTSII